MEGGFDMDWLKRMNLVLDYIEDNLDSKIDESKIASVSATPKGVFQRIFSAITDMTLSEYIRKRRLTQAALDIVNTSEKIIDISVKYGYNSANSFNSAFKKYHGITPSFARKPGAKLQSFQRLTFTLTLSVKGGNEMQYRTIENAEEILQQMVNRKHSRKYLQNISENNGVKCALDGIRAAVIVPKGTADWDLSGAYFVTGEKDKPKHELYSIFDKPKYNYKIEIQKSQIENMPDSINDYKMKTEELTPEIIFLDITKMVFLRHSEALALKENVNINILAFQPNYLKEIIEFICCSDCDIIELHYNDKTLISENGKLGPLVIKSDRLYAAILPVCIKSYFIHKYQ